MPPQTPWHTSGHTPDPLWPVFAHLLRRDGYVGFRMCEQMPDVPGIDPDGVMALVDKDTNTVYLRADLDDGRLRACIGHEMHHLAHPDAGETEVEHRTAHLMVPLSAALAARTDEEIDATARELWVDRQLIRSRIEAGAAEIRQQEAS